MIVNRRAKFKILSNKFVFFWNFRCTTVLFSVKITQVIIIGGDFIWDSFSEDTISDCVKKYDSFDKNQNYYVE